MYRFAFGGTTALGSYDAKSRDTYHEARCQELIVNVRLPRHVAEHRMKATEKKKVKR